MLLHKIIRHLRYRWRYARNISRPQQRMARLLPRQVLSGPFKGMRYLQQSVGSVVLPKLIGTYEQELHPVLLDISLKPYKKFIDIGAAEGYYAVGMSKYILPRDCAVVVFEQDPKGRKLVGELAALNGVGGLEIKGYCDREELARQMNQTDTLLLVDVEGGELDLLDPAGIDFRQADILVELHPVQVAGIEDLLKTRFAATHDITTIEQQPRLFPGEVELPPALQGQKAYLMNEFRGPQNWLWMQRKPGHDI